MDLYTGLDIHSSNTSVGVLDQQFNRIFKLSANDAMIASAGAWILLPGENLWEF
jgi:hypothetical protein